MASSSIIKSKPFLSTGTQAFTNVSCRMSSDGSRKIQELSSQKRGSGYRSSFSGKVATVFGSTGLLGKVISNRLGKIGSQIVIPYRGEQYNYFPLKMCGDLGQVLFSSYHLKDDESILKAMKYSDIVINAIGREWETKNFKFMDVNVHGPERIARLAKQAGVKRFVHISSINARENPDRAFLPRGSRWLQTKWQGENAVLEAFPEATIFRAADIYGHQDSFINHYASRVRLSSVNFRALPLWKKGEHTLKAPVHVSDLTTGIMNAIDDESTKGVTYEAYGPEIYKLSDIVDWMYYYMNKDAANWDYRRSDLRFDPTVFAKALFFQSMPFGQQFYAKMGLDKIEKMSISDDILGLPNLEDLGVSPGTIAEKMPPHLAVWKHALHHIDVSFYREMPKIPVVQHYQAKEMINESRKPLLETLL
ncbi:NADH dehydrogenase [ubiquinone] 1 alpha subcomplex subunit 9, mitochondrial [Lepeophtheirus salmonis]|uniref:NADH dehydrogenase [ubiquinone] 1 alpha subcomplex subunit 9, mitochondrial n=1 Tax=Lepeophtheirus salmonis TaxID=72036 RepID=D3PI75_LEPSM|nr:NADH dehydrogenase [ubiquinone] 1 alpha subcomplex subunit 9, mitochondrial-like [Lepeophtheirus salmonis]ADD38261.1 NADH dehydrogenase 1 alpha subcomplex subunit 9, mitochondrial [Lepeophtheirus salmonis]